MSKENWVQDRILAEKDFPPKQEFEHFYGFTTSEKLDQPLKGQVEDGYYIETGVVKLNVYPSQFKYVDDNFAIVKTGEVTTVFARENKKYWFRPFLAEQYIPIIKREWFDRRDIKFSPNILKGLKIVEGKDLEKATREEIGGKALGLVELKKYEYLGYKIPDFFVVPTSFCKVLQTHGFEGRAEEIMKTYSSPEDIVRRDSSSLGGYMSGVIPKKIGALFDSLNFERGMFLPLVGPAISKLFFENDKPSLIFRSSSPLEDDGENQFQGVFLSERSYYVGEEGEYSEEYKTFKSVLLGPWTAYAEFYYRNRGLVGKASRVMAEIVQVVPKEIEFMGRAFINQGEVEVEYIDKSEASGNWVGNKIFVKNGEVVKRIDNIDDYSRNNTSDLPVLMLNWKAIEIAKLMVALSSKFARFNQKFNIEFCLTGNETYLLQIRPTKRNISIEPIPDLDKIDKAKIMFECSEYMSPFSIGKVVAPVINLLTYNYGYREEPGKEYLDEITDLDKKYPGSIFIVRLNIPSIKDFYMLTPRKKGIIVCYEHDSFTRNDHFVESLYTDPTFHIVNVLLKLFADFKTGTRLGIVSTGEKAVFYTPDVSEPNTIVFEPPTIFKSQKSYTTDARYIQGEFPLKRVGLKKI